MDDLKIDDLKNAVLNRRLLKIERDTRSDEGVVMHFDNGIELHIGWSWNKGDIRIKRKGLV